MVCKLSSIQIDSCNTRIAAGVIRPQQIIHHRKVIPVQLLSTLPKSTLYRTAAEKGKLDHIIIIIIIIDIDKRP